MKVSVYNIYSDSTEVFHGEPEQVRAQLNASYAFLARYGSQSLQDDLQQLSRAQAFIVSVEDQ
jgi:hypothetical protein